MRLSEWRVVAPHPAAVTTAVMAVVEPALAALGADNDPHCLLVWGDDPWNRYHLFAYGHGGMVICHVRVEVPGEGPRASARLVRWTKVGLSEFVVEAVSSYRITTAQIEGSVLRALDQDGDVVAQFARAILARQDGLPFPEFDTIVGPVALQPGEIQPKGSRAREPEAIELPGVFEMPGPAAPG